VRSAPFSLLVLACFSLLLGLRFGIERWAGAIGEAAAKVAAAPEGIMALPPKPEGAADVPAGEGDGEGAALLTRASCEKRKEDARDICFQALAGQSAAADPEGALALCPLIADEEMRLECQADVAERLGPVDVARAELICDGIAVTKWRGQCHFGIGLSLAEVDPAAAVAQCEKSEAFRLFCRHDVNGEVALVNTEAALAYCGALKGDAFERKTCWHGIGKYLARRSLDEAAAACLRVDGAAVANCFHGVGWGAAERDPDAALQGCARRDRYAENCRQGVANELKRGDPQRAVAICQSLQDPGLRDRCLAFVTR
jgi:hypothetical protein